MFQSDSFNGNDLMVLFNRVWSRLIYKLSLIRSLNLFASEARNIKMIKVHLTVTFKYMIRYCWLFDTFRTLSSLIRYTHIHRSSSKKVTVCFTMTSNLAVTIRASVNNVRADLFLKGIFVTEQQIQFVRWLENNFKITEL